MDAIIQRATALHGTFNLPPDKAICHRAVLLSALAAGRTVIGPWSTADDCQRTLQLIVDLGVKCERTNDGLIVHGRGLRGLKPPAHALDCGESGTTFRLAAGLLAGQPFTSTLTASPSLMRRPMQRIVDPLTRMGVQVDGRINPTSPQDIYPPLTIKGRFPLHAIRYEMPVASAQVKSAILLAGLAGVGPTIVVERQPTRDHTERMLRAFGVRIVSQGPEITMEPPELPRLLHSPERLAIPGDISSAAFFLVAASCVPGSLLRLTNVGLNPARVAVVNVLRRMGAAITVEEWADGSEPRGRLTVRAASLSATTIEADEVPGLIDEIPILMVAAACACGTTRFRGVQELRVKETDRIRSMVDGLSRLGARIRVVGQDEVEVEGFGRLTGTAVDSAGDHRTTMSLAVAALTADGETTIRGAECVAKSFPDFFVRLAAAAGSPTVKTVDKA